MKKILSVISVLVFSLALLSAASISSPAATVNLTKNKVITMDMLNTEFQKYSQGGFQVTKLDVLNAMIDDILVEQGAARDGYAVSDSDAELLFQQQKANIDAQAGRSLTDAEFTALIEQSYPSVSEYKSYLKKQYMIQQYVYGVKSDVANTVKEPTEKDIKTWYRQNSSTFMMPEMVRLSLIAMQKTGDEKTDSEKKSKLDKVYSDIRSGSITFEKAVQNYSEDDVSKSNGGDWGFMSDSAETRTSMGDTFVDAVMVLDAGDIEGVFETPYLFCIVKCTVHQEPKILTMDDIIEDYGVTVHEYIRQGLVYQNSQLAYLEAYNALVADLRTQARINILYKEQ